MVALLVSLAIMAIMLTAAMPVWKTIARREKEAELVFRGEQYARAIALFQRQTANAAPPNLDMLVQQRFLRRKYKDPITGDDFALVLVGQSTTPGPQGQPGARSDAAAGGSLGTPGGGTTSPAGAGIGTQTGGIIGVVSKSKEESLRLYNGRNHYNEWVFTAAQRTQAPGVQPGAGAAVPGVGGQPAGRGSAPGGFGGGRGAGAGRGGARGPGSGRGPGGPNGGRNTFGPSSGGPAGNGRFGGLPPQIPSAPPRR
jgi:type II secretory pathway pseudopilin PulG